MRPYLKRILAEKVHANYDAIEKWFAAEEKKAPPPFYSSVDLRDSGFKITPVDSNLYPAGFNNICATDQENSPPLIRANLLKMAGPKTDRVLILSELHTTNKYYLENLWHLKKILEDGDTEVILGWFLKDGETTEYQPGTPFTLSSITEKELEMNPFRVTAEGSLEGISDQIDAIILNNDFSAGYPKELDRVAAAKTPILPTHKLGWHTRRKSCHFIHYNALVEEFCKIIDLDPWALKIESQVVRDVNFSEGIGIDETANAVEKMMEYLKLQYREHGVEREPFVFVKNRNYGRSLCRRNSQYEPT
jgi:glutamate--cysteine ligase